MRNQRLNPNIKRKSKLQLGDKKMRKFYWIARKKMVRMHVGMRFVLLQKC